MMRELTEEERADYDMLVDGAKQLTIFGTEEELDARDYVIERLDEEELEAWLEEDYALGDLWKKNVLGGRLSK